MDLGSAWAFGWDALVAIGTLCLAGVTLWLVITTRRLARSTSDEVRAQWRPAILPGRQGADPAIDFNEAEHRLRVRVRNAGSGPALYIRTHLEPGSTSPDHWSLAALGPDDEVVLTFTGVYQNPTPAQLLFDYRDLGGRQYSSELVIDEVGGVRRFYNAQLYEDHSITGLGDYTQQPGLQDVAPRPSPGIRDRLMAAYRSFRSPTG
jgi:hypothetical protein